MAVIAGSVIPLMFANKFTTITCNVGTSIIMSTIRATTSSIACIINYITSEPNNNIEHIQKFFKDTDLHFTITTIHAFINEQKLSDTKSISTALEGVSDILTIINDDLQLIKNEFDTHKKGYFSSYRAFVWSKPLDTLDGHNKILKHRYDILFELLKIYNFNNTSGEGKVKMIEP